MIEAIQIYSDVDEFVRQSKEPEYYGPRTGRSSREHSASESWDLNAGYDGTVKLAETGWQDGAEEIDSLREEIHSIIEPKGIEMSITPHVSGAFVDIGRYIQGVPECMCQFMHTETNQKPVQLVVNGSVSCGVSAERQKNRGAAIAAAIDVMEERGYRVELWLYFGVRSGISYTIDLVRVKDFNQGVDTDRLAYALAHAGFNRRLHFGVCETRKERFKIGSYPGGGYGAPRETSEEELRTIEGLDSDSDVDLVYIVGINSFDPLGQNGFYTVEESVKWTVGFLSRFGISTAEETGP